MAWKPPTLMAKMPILPFVALLNHLGMLFVI